MPPDPTEGMRDYGIANLDFKRVAGGLLVEDLDDLALDRGNLQVVTHRRPTLEELTDLLFAWRAVRHVRSNAIILARNGATVGIGAGQASRQVSVEIALRRAGDRAKLAVMAVGRVLPVPGRHPARGLGRGDGDHPAGRLHPRRDGDRGRRPPPPGDGVHGSPALPALMEQLLALEMIRVTEAAAIESARFMGRGERDGADAAATEAMRKTMDEIDFAGRIVIGEGERDEAPMLYIGERVGRTGADRDDVPRVDIAVDPLEGTNLVAHGQAGAITVLAASEAGGLTHAPDTYMEKLCVGPVVGRQGRHPRHARPRTCGRIAEALGRKVGDITVVILERPRHDDAHRRGPRRRAPGSSSSATATCRPRSRARCRGPASTRSWASAARPRASSPRRRCAASAARSRPASATAATTSANEVRGWATATRTACTRPRTWPRARTSCSPRPV